MHSLTKKIWEAIDELNSDLSSIHFLDVESNVVESLRDCKKALNQLRATIASNPKFNLVTEDMCMRYYGFETLHHKNSTDHMGRFGVYRSIPNSEYATRIVVCVNDIAILKEKTDEVGLGRYGDCFKLLHYFGDASVYDLEKILEKFKIPLMPLMVNPGNDAIQGFLAKKI